MLQQGLSLAANVIVVVLLPVLIGILKHIAEIRKEFKSDVQVLHKRVKRTEEDVQEHRLHVAQNYTKSPEIHNMINLQNESLKNQIATLGESLNRIERWVEKLSDQKHG